MLRPDLNLLKFFSSVLNRYNKKESLHKAIKYSVYLQTFKAQIFFSGSLIQKHGQKSNEAWMIFSFTGRCFVYRSSSIFIQ